MAQRKQQQEIDRTLKRIQEGLAAFDSIYEKLQAQVSTASAQTSQKEKLEQDLKKEIKKLQRHRDQIKTWAARDDIKDKKPLTDARKAIETEMERFKACEKEMKTKAFSKEGLMASSKMDPKEKERHEMGQFLMDMVEELGKQVEQAEAEIESLQAALKKGRKDSGKTERLSEVEHLVERHKWHQGRLELILRALENGNIQAEQVAGIKDDIDYYVNENQAVDFTEDEDIYNDLNLQEEDEMYGIGDNDHQSSLDAQSVTEEHPPTPQKEDAVTKPKEQGSLNRRSSVATSRPVVTSTIVTAPPPLPNGILKPSSQTARPPTELKYASAAAAATNPASLLGLSPLPPPISAPPNRQASVSSVGSSVGHPARATSPITVSISNPPQSSVPTAPAVPLQKEKTSAAVTNGSPDAGPSPSVSSIPPATPSSTQIQDIVNEPSSSLSELSVLSVVNAGSLNGEIVVAESPISYGVNGSDETDISTLPPGLRDLLRSFQSARGRAEASSLSSAPTNATAKMLEASRLGAPDAFDNRSKKRYAPLTPYQTPPYYPQTPHPTVLDPSFVRRCDVDTLFFMFYYQQETIQQYLAAKELKNQSWRFHKKYITWFQRHEEPKEIQETYELGCYRYFDNQGSWVQRKKPEFQFMYAYLEDDD